MGGVSKLKLLIGLAIAFGVVVAITILGAGVLVARQDTDSSSTMDALERGLETGRHAGLLARIAEGGVNLNAFTTDGCSGGLSSAWAEFSARFPEFAQAHGERPPWEDCCVAHDRQYHGGGADSDSATDSFSSRKQADLDLMQCVVDTGMSRADGLRETYGISESQARVLYVGIAESMYRAVRLGGVPCTELPWRWGYGWPLCRSE